MGLKEMLFGKQPEGIVPKNTSEVIPIERQKAKVRLKVFDTNRDLFRAVEDFSNRLNRPPLPEDFATWCQRFLFEINRIDSNLEGLTYKEQLENPIVAVELQPGILLTSKGELIERNSAAARQLSGKILTYNRLDMSITAQREQPGVRLKVLFENIQAKLQPTQPSL